jgi:ribosome-binding protein aMBF1 (putative translation factor)
VIIPFESLKARRCTSPLSRRDHAGLAPDFDVSAELVRARLRAGLSQDELAVRMGTRRFIIQRLENGQTLPSTKTLLRYAQATESRLQIRLPAA